MPVKCAKVAKVMLVRLPRIFYLPCKVVERRRRKAKALPGGGAIKGAKAL